MTKHVLEALRSKGFAPGTMLDIGAHIGSFTCEFLRIFPNCVPTLLEPNPFCQADLARLGFEQHAVAASSAPGRAEMFLSTEWLQSTGASLYRENTAHFRDEVVMKQAVEKVRLDDLFAGRRFDFVKIDTQGAELDVILGGANLLSQASYILVEISLVEYNIGGATAEAVFAKLDELGFHCTEVTEFHRLKGVANGNLLQMDFLFERRGFGVPALPALAGLQSLAQSLEREGRLDEALLLLDHLTALQPRDAQLQKQRVTLLGTRGETLKVLQALVAMKAAGASADYLLGEIQALMPAALELFNAHVAAGEIELAEKYIAALAALLPGNVAILNSAVSCNLALGRQPDALKYASVLVAMPPPAEAPKQTKAVPKKRRAKATR